MRSGSAVGSALSGTAKDPMMKAGYSSTKFISAGSKAARPLRPSWEILGRASNSWEVITFTSGGLGSGRVLGASRGWG